MQYFELFGASRFWFGCLLTGAVLTVVFALAYTMRYDRKRPGPDGEIPEHDEPGVPLVLKMLYLGMAIWYLAVLYLMAVGGATI
jgi:hypothetical protein